MRPGSVIWSASLCLCVGLLVGDRARAGDSDLELEMLNIEWMLLHQHQEALTRELNAPRERLSIDVPSYSRSSPPPMEMRPYTPPPEEPRRSMRPPWLQPDEC
jgi:hypothetical protein